MFSYCTDYAAKMPSITIYMNCDTILAVNLNAFNLCEDDELIFIIKNYSYIESSYAFLYKARSSDKDENGEVFIRIPPATSKHIKPGAFYNFAVMKNASAHNKPTEYKKLTYNGSIAIEYGAQDFLVTDDDFDLDSEVVGVRLEPIDDESIFSSNAFTCEISGIRLELIEE